jgi:hypothetical protein
MFREYLSGDEIRIVSIGRHRPKTSKPATRAAGLRCEWELAHS